MRPLIEKAGGFKKMTLHEAGKKFGDFATEHADPVLLPVETCAVCEKPLRDHWHHRRCLVSDDGDVVLNLKP